MNLPPPNVPYRCLQCGIGIAWGPVIVAPNNGAVHGACLGAWGKAQDRMALTPWQGVHVATPPAARPHTDGVDDRAESISGTDCNDGSLTHETLAQRLTKAAYRTPALGHHCRGCNAELPDDAVCGAMCKRCSEEAAALHAQTPAHDNSVWWAVGFGALIGALILYVALLSVGVIR